MTNNLHVVFPRNFMDKIVATFESWNYNVVNQDYSLATFYDWAMSGEAQKSDIAVIADAMDGDLTPEQKMAEVTERLIEIKLARPGLRLVLFFPEEFDHLIQFKSTFIQLGIYDFYFQSRFDFEELKAWLTSPKTLADHRNLLTHPSSLSPFSQAAIPNVNNVSAQRAEVPVKEEAKIQNGQKNTDSVSNETKQPKNGQSRLNKVLARLGKQEVSAPTETPEQNVQQEALTSNQVPVQNIAESQQAPTQVQPTAQTVEIEQQQYVPTQVQPTAQAAEIEQLVSEQIHVAPPAVDIMQQKVLETQQVPPQVQTKVENNPVQESTQQAPDVPVPNIPSIDIKPPAPVKEQETEETKESIMTAEQAEQNNKTGFFKKSTPQPQSIKTFEKKSETKYVGVPTTSIAVVGLSRLSGSSFHSMNLARFLANQGYDTGLYENPIHYHGRTYLSDILDIDTEEITSLPHAVKNRGTIPHPDGFIEDDQVTYYITNSNDLIKKFDYDDYLRMINHGKHAFKVVDIGTFPYRDSEKDHFKSLLMMFDKVIVIVDVMPHVFVANSEQFTFMRGLEREWEDGRISFVLNKKDESIPRSELKRIAMDNALSFPMVPINRIYKSMFSSIPPLEIEEIHNMLYSHYVDLVEELKLNVIHEEKKISKTSRLLSRLTLR